MIIHSDIRNDFKYFKTIVHFLIKGHHQAHCHLHA